MMAVLIASVLAYGFVGRQSTSIAIARNGSDLCQARAVAGSGLELMLGYLEATPTWRDVRVQGTWIANQALSGGTFSVSAQDGSDVNGDGVIAVPAEGDGDLSADNGGNDDVFTLTITGRYGDSSHVLRAVITPLAGDESLVGHWKLDENSGYMAEDSSGKGHDGTVTNTTAPDWQPARIDGGLDLDGTDDYVDVADHADLDLSTQGTLACWAKMDLFKNFAGLIHKGDQKNFSDEAYTVQLWSGSYVYFGLKGSANRNLTCPTHLLTNTWYHIAAVWDSTGMRVYLNGVLEKSSTSTVVAMNSAGDLNLGAQLPVYYSNSYKNLPFDGVMDDIRIYNRALSATEILDLANLNAPAGSTTYLVDLR